MQILSYIKDEKDSEKEEIEGKKKQRTEHHPDDKEKKGRNDTLDVFRKIFKLFYKKIGTILLHSVIVIIMIIEIYPYRFQYK